MLTCSVTGNAGRAPLLRIAEGTWQTQVTVHQAGAYSGGLVHRPDGTTIAYRLVWDVALPAPGVLTITFWQDDESLSVELRQVLLDLAA